MMTVSKAIVLQIEKFSNPEHFKKVKEEYIRTHFNCIGVINTPYKNIEIYTS